MQSLLTLLIFSPETFVSLNFLFNFITFIIAIIGAIIVVANFSKNKYWEFKNPPRVFGISEDEDYLFLLEMEANFNLERLVPRYGDERSRCERLRGYGIFTKKNGSYRITRAGKKMMRRSKNL